MGLVQWHRIANTVLELFPGKENLKEILVAGKSICLARQGNKLYGVTALCPHAGGALCNGYIDKLGNIVCPVHHYRFQLGTGRNISGEGYHLKTFAIEEREDGIYIGF